MLHIVNLWFGWGIFGLLLLVFIGWIVGNVLKIASLRDSDPFGETEEPRYEKNKTIQKKNFIK